jgi:glycosyltransferase involved in cell wall biosynthesis
MRVLHVVPTYLPAWRYGGPIKSVHGLCKGLAALGHDIQVFTTNVDGPGRLDVPLGTPVDIDGVKVRYFPSKILRRLYRSPEMARAVDNEIVTFDLLHLHSVFLWPTTMAVRKARRAGIPYVLSPRGMLVKDLIRRKSRWIKSAWIELFDRRNIANAASVHFTSKVEAVEAERMGFRTKATCIIPNGLDDDEISQSSIPSTTEYTRPFQGSPFLLFVGRVNWVKGLDRLILALPWIKEAGLVIAGNDDGGYQPHLEKLASDHGVRDRIKFLGPVYGAQKLELMRQASALVLPSYSENFGNVVLEAMAVGCPVVVTPEVGAADVVLETGAGVVLEGKPQVMGPGLQSLLSDASALKAMSDQGREAITTKFTWRAIAAQMESEYRRIIHAKASAS